MPSVKPSGAALATTSEPITPLAPARFSTTTGWPSRSLKRWLISRAITSTAEPAGSGTIMRSGRSGQFAGTVGLRDAAPALDDRHDERQRKPHRDSLPEFALRRRLHCLADRLSSRLTRPASPAE